MLVSVHSSVGWYHLHMCNLVHVCLVYSILHILTFFHRSDLFRRLSFDVCSYD